MSNYARQLIGLLIVGMICVLAFSLPAFAALLRTPGYHGLSVTREIPDFTLQTARGENLTPAELTDTYTYIFFGYARCTGVCPRALHELRELSNRGAQDFRVLFISLDSVRDTAADLIRIEESGGPAWIALRGDLRTIQDLARSFHGPCVYDNKRAAEGGDYQFNHPGFVYLAGPDGRLRLIYTTGFGTDHLLSDLTLLNQNE